MMVQAKRIYILMRKVNHHNSFTYKVTHLWNQLPTYIKQSPNLNEFDKNLETFNLLKLRTSCECDFYRS